jgi:hypothetical protein
LISFGLLAGAFRPKGDLCALRSVARQREMLLNYQARHVQHMQKALTQMNIQLAQVISDMAGETGQKIIRAILAGERDGQALAKLVSWVIRYHQALRFYFYPDPSVGYEYPEMYNRLFSPVLHMWHSLIYSDHPL